jgi:hypothetical protein
MNKDQLDQIIKVIPQKINVKSAEMLYQASDWDLESCRYFTWSLKNEIVNYFKGYGTENFGVIYMPDLSLMGISRSAPMGSRRQKKNLEKIVNEMGTYTIDKNYKDVFENFISYLGMTVFRYYIQGQTSLLNGLADPKYFVTTLQTNLELIFVVNEDIEEGEELWDPYKVQEIIVKNISAQNAKLDKNDEESEKKPQLIPENFNILKDVEKLSPLKMDINNKYVREVNNSDFIDLEIRSENDFEDVQEIELETETNEDNSESKFEKLQKLADMLEQGLIDKEEFENLKKEII